MKGKSCKEMARWATSALILCCVLGIVGAGTSSINDHSCHGESIFRPHVGLDEAAESTNRWSHRPGVESHIHHRSQFCESFLQRRGRVCGSGPGHSFQAIREKIFGSEKTCADAAPMNGFAQQATSLGGANMSQTVMNGFRLEVVPVYNTLVSEFAVFDRWFASVLASTQPNRLYVHSATSHGATSNIPKLLANGYPQKTIFESIDESGLSFGIYYQNILATLFYRNLRKLKYIGNFHSYSTQFKAHASKGKLPNYVVVEQRYMDSKLFPANDMLKLRDTFDLVLDWFWIPL